MRSAFAFDNDSTTHQASLGTYRLRIPTHISEPRPFVLSRRLSVSTNFVPHVIDTMVDRELRRVSRLPGPPASDGRLQHQEHGVRMEDGEPLCRSLLDIIRRPRGLRLSSADLADESRVEEEAQERCAVPLDSKLVKFRVPRLDRRTSLHLCMTTPAVRDTALILRLVGVGQATRVGFDVFGVPVSILSIS